MRIHPIRDLHEALIHPLHEECHDLAFRPNWLRCPPYPCVCEHPVRCRGCCGEYCCCRRCQPNINEVLLRRAMAGVLTRLRSFDWQVIHGHYVGDSGHSLDVSV